MAKHLKNLNLEEQEQLEQLKGFWAEYGRLITLTAVVLLVVIVGWVGWQFWQNQQARGAAVIYDKLNEALVRNDADQAKQAVTEIQEQYGRATYASQSALVAVNLLYTQGQLDSAKEILSWVTEHGRDPGLKGLAVLRLADILMDQKDYDRALAVLATEVPEAFAGLVNDKRGMVYVAQGKIEEAKAAYSQAYRGLAMLPESQQMVANKLSVLGVDVTTLVPAGEPRS